VTAGHVGDVHNADEIEILFELGEQIAFCNLLVKEIV